MRRRILQAAVLISALTPGTASADTVIEAQTVWRFDAATYPMDQGEPLLFRNRDAVSPGPHNVVASQNGPDGRPLFESKTIENEEEAPVERARQLTTGEYDFICTVHPFMQATLVVSDRGTPEPPPTSGTPPPPPPPATDTRPPALNVSLARTSLKKALRRRRFVATASTDEPATLRIRLTARLGRRTRTVGTATAEADRSVTIRVRIRRSARRPLRRARRTTLTLAVEARDAAGNVGTATARRRVSR